MNLIQKELERSRAYSLEVIQGSERHVGRQLVKLSLDNVPMLRR